MEKWLLLLLLLSNTCHTHKLFPRYTARWMTFSFPFRMDMKERRALPLSLFSKKSWRKDGKSRKNRRLNIDSDDSPSSFHTHSQKSRNVNPGEEEKKPLLSDPEGFSSIFLFFFPPLFVDGQKAASIDDIGFEGKKKRKKVHHFQYYPLRRQEDTVR